MTFLFIFSPAFCFQFMSECAACYYRNSKTAAQGNGDTTPDQEDTFRCYNNNLRRPFFTVGGIIILALFVPAYFGPRVLLNGELQADSLAILRESTYRDIIEGYISHIAGGLLSLAHLFVWSSMLPQQYNKALPFFYILLALSFGFDGGLKLMKANGMGGDPNYKAYKDVEGSFDLFLMCVFMCFVPRLLLLRKNCEVMEAPTKNRMMLHAPIALMGVVLFLTGIIGLFAPAVVWQGEVIDEVKASINDSQFKYMTENYCFYANIWVWFLGSVMIWSAATLNRLKIDVNMVILHAIFTFYFFINGFIVKMSIQGSSGKFKGKGAEGAGYLIMMIVSAVVTVCFLCQLTRKNGALVEP